MSTLTARITAEDFLGLDDNGLELLDGEIQEKRMGTASSYVGTEIVSELRNWVKPRNLGVVLNSEAGYRIWPDRPDHLRKPDASFVSRSKMPSELPAGWLHVAPDLAVEVVSPGDTAGYLNDKLADYAAAGVTLTWVIYPDSRQARIYRDGHETAFVQEEGILSGEDVLPGFTLHLVDVLPPRSDG